MDEVGLRTLIESLRARRAFPLASEHVALNAYVATLALKLAALEARLDRIDPRP